MCIRDRLLTNPIHYRDLRTSGMRREAAAKIEESFLYEITGSQFMEINTFYQLLAEKKIRKDLFGMAEQVLFLPDLFGYFLSGERTAEYSIASTSQLLDARGKSWSEEILKAAGISRRLFPAVSYTHLSSDFCRDTVPLGSCSDQCIFFFIFTKCKRRYAICPGQYQRADPKPHPVYFRWRSFYPS